MSITPKQLAELVALAKDGRLIVRTIGRDLSWAPNEFALARQLVMLAKPEALRQATKRDAQKVMANSRKRVKQAADALSKRAAP